jgi:hypothetical protein
MGQPGFPIRLRALQKLGRQIDADCRGGDVVGTESGEDEALFVYIAESRGDPQSKGLDCGEGKDGVGRRKSLEIGQAFGFHEVVDKTVMTAVPALDLEVVGNRGRALPTQRPLLAFCEEAPFVRGPAAVVGRVESGEDLEAVHEVTAPKIKTVIREKRLPPYSFVLRTSQIVAFGSTRSFLMITYWPDWSLTRTGSGLRGSKAVKALDSCWHAANGLTFDRGRFDLEHQGLTASEERNVGCGCRGRMQSLRSALRTRLNPLSML